MDQTSSCKILYTQEMKTVVDGIAASSQSDYKTALIEPLGNLLGREAPSFPYCPSFDEAVRHPVVVLHSSGSTGLPKPVIMTHGTFTVMDNDRNFPTVAGRKNHDLTIWDFDGTPSRIYEPFPPFHLAGFFNKIMVPLYTHAIPVFGPPLRPPSGTLVADIMTQQKVRGCVLPPSVAEQLLHEPNGRNLLKQLDVFCYAGGPLSEAAGDLISEFTMVCQFYGSTEVGQVRQLVPRREDWSYMEFHPHAKLEFRPSDDDAFELIVYADETQETVSLNYNYPEVAEWHTKDLFKPHPSKQNLWRFHGRKDDIIVLSNGEKLNPVPMESQLQGLPIISGAVVTGNGRFQPALLLEINRSDTRATLELIDEIWPAVESANAKMPGYGRIVRSMILLAKADKPFIRAGKGTVVRKLTEKAYADEIRDLYAETQQKSSIKRSPLVATAFTLEAINQLIRSILPSSLNADKLKDSDDLYTVGLDSLKTIEAVKAIRDSLLPHREPSKLAWLSAETIYQHPSIGQLSQLLLTFLNDGTISQIKDRATRMSEMLQDFAVTSTNPQKVPVTDRKPDGLSIALTGTTGTLGSYLLAEYLRYSTISNIYCLNRSPSAEKQWHDICTRHSIHKSPNSTRLTFITVDFGHEDLGLHNSHYISLIKDCDFILHTAWKVDFNQDLFSFTENVRSVQTLANWSCSSPQRPRIIFLSSISSVGPWNPTFENGPGIPEAAIEDLEAALNIGYGESKQVAERLLDRAATEFQVPVSILRVGQIGGAATDTQTKWTQREMIPSLLRTSRSIGLIPADLPDVDWIPVDFVSKIVVELTFEDIKHLSHTPRYYHIVNPQPVAWRNFVPLVERYCGPGVQVIPLSQWVKELRTSNATDATELTTKPALKLLNFLSLTASNGPTTKFQTFASKQASRTMAGLEPVDSALMQRWIDQSTST